MAPSNATVKVTFLGDTSSLSRAAQQAQGDIGKVSSGLGIAKGALGALALGGAAVGAFSFAKGLLADAEESAKVARLSEAVVKSTGGAANITAKQMGDLSTAISNKTGADDEAIQSGENLLATFTGIKNGVGANNQIFDQATSTVVDMTAALNDGNVSTDGIKASSIQLGKALNDPIKGIGALSKVGVSFTQAQKDSIKAMVKSGDVMGAQKVILKELKTEFGGAAAAASTPAQKATVAWGNLREQLGGYLIPVVAKVATLLTSTVIPAVSRFFTGVAQGNGIFGRIRSALAAFGSYIQSTVLPLLQRFGAWFLAAGWPAIKRFAQAFWADLQPAIRAIANAFQNQLRPALVQAIAKFREAWPTIQRVLTILGQVAGFILSRVIPVIIALYSRYLAAWIRTMATVFAAAWRVIGVLITFGAGVGRAGAAFGRFVVTVTSAITRMVNAVTSGIGKAVSVVKAFPGKAVAAVGKLGQALYQVGIDFVQGFINGVKNAIPNMLGAVGDMASGALNKAKGLLHLGSPSRLTHLYGVWFAEGFADGIESGAGRVARATKTLVDASKKTMQQVKEFAKGIRDAWISFGDITSLDSSSNAGILSQLQQKADQAAAFRQGFLQLRKMGLNTTTLNQLRDAGPGSLDVVRQLLGSGSAGVSQANSLVAAIRKQGGAFAASEAQRKYAPQKQTVTHRVVVDVTGGDQALKQLLRKMIRIEGGNVQTVLGAA